MVVAPNAGGAVVVLLPNWNKPVEAGAEPVDCPGWNGVLPVEAVVVPALNENGEADAVVFTAPKLKVGAELAAEVPNGVCEVDTVDPKGLGAADVARVPNTGAAEVVAGFAPNANPVVGADVPEFAPNIPEGALLEAAPKLNAGAEAVVTVPNCELATVVTAVETCSPNTPVVAPEHPKTPNENPLTAAVVAVAG